MEEIITPDYLKAKLLAEINEWYDRKPQYAMMLSEIYKNLGG